MPDDKIGAIRQLLQDLIAPAVGRIEERVGSLAGECVRLGGDLETNRGEIKELWQALSEDRERIARVEGRFDSVKEELVAKVQLELARRLPPPSGATALPDSNER
ncbi:MAG TPA: hypothetical protein VGG03_09190 [Thermoanaerobaculia bacterium]